MGRKRKTDDSPNIPTISLIPKTPAQEELIAAIKKNDITFAVGSAGTGKTYCAMSMGLKYLLDGSVSRLVVVRPAVESGEKLGFLPGTIEEKMDPYLQPVYDTIRKHLGFTAKTTLLATGQLEISPLSYMRGRTLDNAFVVFDEAQNATPDQMEMFLTRIGNGSTFVICGDPTQNDLSKNQICGMADACKRLTDMQGIAVVRFSAGDAVRHRLIPSILERYKRE